nr:Lar family restriction alleviation protein [Cronobacter dublinensis]
MNDLSVDIPHGLKMDACPFCGGAARLYVEYGRGGQDAYFTGCYGGNCHVMPITLVYATKRDAIRAWNLRAPQDPADPVVPKGRLVAVKGGHDV